MAAKKAAPKKKAAAPKAAAPKAAPAKPATPKAIKEAYTKTQLLNAIVEDTGVSKKDVNAVLDSLKNAIHGHIRKTGAGQFTMPGLMKVKTIRKPAQKARKNVPNPFKPGEVMDVAAKPARTVVKVLPLKALKDMAN